MLEYTKNSCVIILDGVRQVSVDGCDNAKEYAINHYIGHVQIRDIKDNTLIYSFDNYKQLVDWDNVEKAAKENSDLKASINYYKGKCDKKYEENEILKDENKILKDKLESLERKIKEDESTFKDIYQKCGNYLN